MRQHQPPPADQGESHPGRDRHGSGQAPEAARRDTGTRAAIDRSTGTASARHAIGMDPQEPRDGGSAAG